MIRKIRLSVLLLTAVSAGAYVASGIINAGSGDDAGPVISLVKEPIVISVEDDKDQLLEYINAVDNVDGDVTVTSVVESVGNFAADGTRAAVVAAFDRSGNVSKKGITFSYSDYTSPVVSLSGPLSVPANSSEDILDLIAVTDCLDGDITSNVTLVTGKSISSTVSDTYAATIQVSNSAGDSVSIPATLDLYLNSDRVGKPVLTLTDYLVYIEEGSKFDPYSYLDTISVYKDTYIWSRAEKAFVYDDPNKEENSESDDSDYYSEDDTEETPSIQADELDIDNPVKTKVPGCYEVTYTFDSFDNGSGQVRLIVIVEEK